MERQSFGMIFPFLYVTLAEGKGSSTIVEDIKAILQAQPETGLAYFYFDTNDKARQTTDSLLASLVLDLTARSRKYDLLHKLYDNHNRLHTPTDSELMDVLMELLKGFTQAYIIIDALDECVAYYQLFETIRIIHGWEISHFHLLVSSRREQNILETIQECSHVEVCLSTDKQKEDITAYVHFSVAKEHKLKRWGSDVQQQLMEALISGADGMCVSA